MNDPDILLLFVPSNAKGTDSVAGDVDETLESKRKAGSLSNLAHCPNRRFLRDGGTIALNSSYILYLSLSLSLSPYACTS